MLHRPLRDDHPDPRARRLDGRQARASRRRSGTFPTTGPLFVGPADRRDRHRRGAHLLPGPGARTRSSSNSSRTPGGSSDAMTLCQHRPRTRHAPLPALRQRSAALKPERRAAQAARRPRSGPAPCRASRKSFRKLDPRRMIKNPVMFVVEITAALVTLIAIANVTGFQPVTGPAGLGFQVQIAVVALVHGPLRDLCRGPRRGARASPGIDAAPDTLGDDRPPSARRRHARGCRVRQSFARATSSSFERPRRSPVTATSSRAWPTSTGRDHR